MSLLEQIFQAGIVGAGGAGFPTHKKIVSDAKLLIVNAAECEPLLTSDRYVMRHFADEIIDVLSLIKKEFNIGQVVIGTKSKYTKEIDSLQKAIDKQQADITIHGVKAYYPAGDEQMLIYEISGETVPPGGIPLALGIVVINITTALFIHYATQNIPVTRKYVTVNGEVGHPVIVDTPVGTSISDCIKAAGGATTDPYTIIKGGPMMGHHHPMSEADNQVIGKADGGIVILNENHPLIQFSLPTIERMINQAKSVCIQCSYCTEMCSRYLIGHQIRPHLVMRSVSTNTNACDLTDALLCSECGICELFACPMHLSPRRMNVYIKGLLREQNIKVTDQTVHQEYTEMREYRLIAQSRIINRLAITQFPNELDEVVSCQPSSVTIPLRHGVGMPSTAIAQVGDKVQVGDIIAGVEFSDIGSMIHASIDGTITNIDQGGITIQQEGGNN